MNYLYQTLINIILWLIRMVTPSEGPVINNKEKWRSKGSKINLLDTGYGFSVDKCDTSVKILDTILKHIPIFDMSPNIDPEITKSHLDKEYGSRVPSEAINPKSLTDFLVNNTGSYFLELQGDDTYVADFSNYEKYEVRPGFERYGGKVFIKNNKIIEYEYQGHKYPANDQKMDNIVRSTLCLKLMVEMHALRIHLCTAQRKTFEYHNKYTTEHPLADFLYLSTYGVMDVNRRIPILVGPHGLVIRLFALTKKSYQQLIKNILVQSDFSREEILGSEGTVWNKSITEYTNLVDKFISKLTNDQDERTDLANFFIASTALHNQFGDAQTFAMTISNFFLPKIYTHKPGFISKLDQNLLIALLYAVSPRYPLIIEESTAEIFSKPEHKEAWKIFQKDILEYYETGGWFDMRTAEISVGF